MFVVTQIKSTGLKYSTLHWLNFVTLLSNNIDVLRYKAYQLVLGKRNFKMCYPLISFTLIQLKYLENIVKVHERTISDLEDENVQMSKEYEERQLLWEQREVELERTVDKLEKQQEQLADAAAKFEEATGSIPDPNLPVANQLELAIRKIKEHIRIIVGTREENKLLKKV